MTGAITILWSLNDLRAGNIMFDGGSICESVLSSDFPMLFIGISLYIQVLFGTTVAMYLNTVLPSTLLILLLLSADALRLRFPGLRHI